MDQRAIAAMRTDWTIHIGVVVRKIADLMGLVARFERNRIDTVLRSRDGDEIAVEWEWDDVHGNELKKLKGHTLLSLDPDSGDRVEASHRRLRYAVFVTYADTLDIEKECAHVKREWANAPWPLLLILIGFEKTKKFVVGRKFVSINMFVFDSEDQRPLRTSPAFPWEVGSSRWFVRTP
jgi:hypothetical protein